MTRRHEPFFGLLLILFAISGASLLGLCALGFGGGSRIIGIVLFVIVEALSYVTLFAGMYLLLKRQTT